jgi:hypothetical protein
VLARWRPSTQAGWHCCPHTFLCSSLAITSVALCCCTPRPWPYGRDDPAFRRRLRDLRPSDLADRLGVQRYLPWVTVLVGGALVAGGIWLLSGRSLPTFGWSLRGPKIGRGLVSTVAFGAAYAMASLTCSIAPFLALVVDSFRASSILGGMALFIAYTLGIGLLVGTAAVAVALALE